MMDFAYETIKYQLASEETKQIEMKTDLQNLENKFDALCCKLIDSKVVLDISSTEEV